MEDRFGSRILKAGADEKTNLAAYHEVSPVNYLCPGSPPLLMMQGDKDPTIRVQHAHYIKERGDTAKARVETFIVQNSGHDWREAGGALRPTLDEIMTETADFMKQRFDHNQERQVDYRLWAANSDTDGKAKPFNSSVYIHPPIVAWRASCDRAKSTCESAVVGEAAVESDFGDAGVGFAEEAGAGGDAGFGDELHRTDAVDAFDDAGESGGAHAGFFGERGRTHGFIKRALEMPQSQRDGGRHLFAAHEGGQIFGNADEAGHAAVFIADGQFACEPPHGHMRATPEQLQALDDRLAGAQDLRVLLGGNAPEVPGTHIAGPFADHLRFAIQTMPLHERLIHHQITPRGVFDEKCRVMHQIGHLLDKLRVDQKVPAGREDAGKR